jgi:hypothetical protein
VSLTLLFPPQTVGGGTITFDHTNSSVGASVTTLTVDITAATVGAFCYCYIQIANPETAVTFTGWTSLVDADESTFTHYSIWRRQKQGGDTTFAPSWPTAADAAAGWVSYTGLSTSTPDEQFAAVAHTSTANYVTPTATPTAATRWALAFFGYRSTTAQRSWTADAALTQRVTNTTTANRWSGLSIEDSNGTVTAAAHSYTAVLSAAESHGATAILFLVPGAGPSFTFHQPIVLGQSTRRASIF